ncbi:hypothetical protein AGMMS49936_07700 [Endomicrobiia bacterium]|nr:hypothetical protein AGMMS49936_07700 [Endomicrobiia bacterium]
MPIHNAYVSPQSQALLDKLKDESRKSAAEKKARNKSSLSLIRGSRAGLHYGAQGRDAMRYDRRNSIFSHRYEESAVNYSGSSLEQNLNQILLREEHNIFAPLMGLQYNVDVQYQRSSALRSSTKTRSGLLNLANKNNAHGDPTRTALPTYLMSFDYAGSHLPPLGYRYGYELPQNPLLNVSLSSTSSFLSIFSTCDNTYDNLIAYDPNLQLFPKGNGTLQSIQYSPQISCYVLSQNQPVNPTGSSSSNSSKSLIYTSSSSGVTAVSGMQNNQKSTIVTLYRKDVKNFKTGKPFNDRGVTGTLRFGDLTVETLENGGFKLKNGEIIPICIQDGIYSIEIRKPTKRFPQGSLRLSDAHGRTGILIHAGSRPYHSDGCILVSPENLTKLIAKAKELEAEGPMVRISVQSDKKVREDFDNIPKAEQKCMADGYYVAYRDRR